MSAPVLAAHRWPTNAHLIADVARLGYLDGHVLDPTHGKGTWWLLWQPERLTTLDADPTKRSDVRGDFAALPFAPSTFDAAAFDPPYISVGGRATSTVPGFLNAYGIDAAPSSPAGVRALIAAGLAELLTVVRPRGYVLCKAMDYVTSGRLYPGAHYALADALAMGYTLADRFEHVGDPGPQPTNRTRRCSLCAGDGCPTCGGTGRLASVQQHARRNLSTLLVLRCPTRRGS